MMDKRVLVCGMAKSGIAAARLLRRAGARVTLQDLKRPEQLDASIFKDEGIDVYLGKNPDDIVTDFDLLVISPGISIYLPFVEKAKENGIPVWGEIELAYTMCPCPIVAITGTNGKTTTTALTGEILKAHNPLTEVVGNIGVPFTGKVEELTEDSVAVAEISSFQLETAINFRPHISAVLNITPDHLDRHKTFETYRYLKGSIGKNQTRGDFMILNYDDPLCRKIETRADKVFFSRLSPLAEGVFLRGSSIYVRLNGNDYELLDVNKMKIFGNHSIENALAAVAMSVCAGVPANTIRNALMEFRAAEHRFEFVEEINGVAYYNDSKATNTDAAIKALEAMKSPVILIGGGYDKQSDFGSWVGMFKDKVKHLVVLGQVADKIIETCRAYGFTYYDKVNSLKDAVDLAAGKAEPGDCVLLSPACASWDMFDSFEQRGNLFKEFVRVLYTGQQKYNKI